MALRGALWHDAIAERGFGLYLLMHVLGGACVFAAYLRHFGLSCCVHSVCFLEGKVMGIVYIRKKSAFLYI